MKAIVLKVLFRKFWPENSSFQSCLAIVSCLYKIIHIKYSKYIPWLSPNIYYLYSSISCSPDFLYFYTTSLSPPSFPFFFSSFCSFVPSPTLFKLIFWVLLCSIQSCWMWNVTYPELELRIIIPHPHSWVMLIDVTNHFEEYCCNGHGWI